MELAAVIDAGEPFVKASYTLEGDNPLALNCYEIVSDLFAGIHVQHYPCSSSKISGGIPDYEKACVAPGLQYLKVKFSDSGELGESVAAFKAVRLLWPQKMFEMQPTSHDVDALQVFPFLNELTILKAERVLSLLQNSFGSFQDAALSDYLQASMMLQYNKR